MTRTEFYRIVTLALGCVGDLTNEENAIRVPLSGKFTVSTKTLERLRRELKATDAELVYDPGYYDSDYEDGGRAPKLEVVFEGVVLSD